MMETASVIPTSATMRRPWYVVMLHGARVYKDFCHVNSKYPHVIIIPESDIVPLLCCLMKFKYNVIMTNTHNAAMHLGTLCYNEC